MPIHWGDFPAANPMLSEAVPTASSLPWTMNLASASNSTSTPGSMVSVCPAGTVTSPVTRYGLLSEVHVVEVIVPYTTTADAGDAKSAMNTDSVVATMPRLPGWGQTRSVSSDRAVGESTRGKT